MAFANVDMATFSKPNDTKDMTIEARFKWFEDALDARLPDRSRAWFVKARGELGQGVDANRFCALFSMASRYARAIAVDFTAEELNAASRLVGGWCPEGWNLRMLLRGSLVLSLPNLNDDEGAAMIEEAFRYADEGEACALYASLCLLPEPGRFVVRSAEGCRTNMVSVFEANVCGTPFPAAEFDDVAWNQCVIKCIFIGSPLWRVANLDNRLSSEIARIALDLVDERRSAGRAIQPDLWLCLGEHGGDRGLDAMLVELEDGAPIGRAAAGYALARAKQANLLEERSVTEQNERVIHHFNRALSGICDQSSFGELEFSEATDGEV
ncbi:MAG: hypothetical protein ACI8TQ_001719 [Planctomycetota bacterium]